MFKVSLFRRQTGILVGIFFSLKTRPQLTVQEVNKNAKTYLAQAGKVIDIKRVEIRRNSEWYDKMKPNDFIRLFSKITLARILERDDFQKRMKNNINIYPHEIIYPILQGYDSIVVESDVEIGGTDQKFNMLIGRRLQEKEGMEPQDIITVPLLVGLDGKNKMSKSLGNYVGITEPAFQQYGKIMSIPDNLILDYFKLLTDVPLKEIAKMERDLKSKRVNPKELKSSLAKEIVTFYHGKEQAEMAEKEFERVFKEKEVIGHGVSYCPICDAPFFQDKTVAIIGGGNAGFEAALDLSKYAKKIYILEISSKVIADEITQEQVRKTGKVEVILNAKVKEILSKKENRSLWCKGLIYKDLSSKKEKELKTDGVFIMIGEIPATDFARGLVEFNEKDEIVVDLKTCQTKTRGLFACGDVTNILYHQIVIAAGEGAKAALSAYNYLKETSEPL